MAADTDTSADTNAAPHAAERAEGERVGADGAIPLRRGLGLLVRAVAPQRRRFWVAFGWLALAGLLDALGPLLGKYFIDEQLRSGSLDPTTSALLLGGMLVAGWAAGLLRYFTLIRLAGVAMDSVRRLREWVHEHVLHLPLSWFDRAITGQVVSRVTNDTEQIRQLYQQVMFEVLQGLTVLAGAIAAMAWLDWRLMLIVLTLVPVMTGIVWLYRRLSAAAVARTRELRSDINARMAEGIAGMAVLQASGAAGRAGAGFARLNDAYYGSRMREIRANAFMLRPALDLVNMLLIVAAIAAFGLLHLDTLEVGLLYAFIAYIGRVVEPLIQITQQFSILQQSLVAAARVEQLLEEPRAIPGGSVGAMHDASLRLQGLSFGYAPDAPVLRGLDLEIAPGEFIGVVGHTGAGKSTLLALLLRFYAPTHGRILIGGVPLRDLAEQAFRADVGLVPQEPFLLAASARENIDMGRGLDHARIESAARQAGAHAFLSRLEQGYDTPLGEGGARLSAGEKQLLAIARALAGTPRILLLDEATARVDSDTEQQVSHAIRALHGRVTVIAIAHRLSTVRAADRIVVLDHGRIAELGTHDALMAIPAGIYQRLYELQRIAD